MEGLSNYSARSRNEAGLARRLPFIKWPGGKRWLADFFAERVNVTQYRRYVEPFLGGGAMFFALAPRKALLADINGELINTYLQAKYQPERLIQILKGWPVSLAKYKELREWEPESRDLRAARFLYLNRTCFGGMYRVNRDGRFNVPYGGGDRTPACLWERKILVNASRVLRNARLVVADFEIIIDQAAAGDLVYCDPAYTVAHNNNGFIRYNESVFTWADQERLARACVRANGRGARVFVSNAYHSSVMDLYSGAKMHTVERMSLLASRAEKRRKIEEVLIEL